MSTECNQLVCRSDGDGDGQWTRFHQSTCPLFDEFQDGREPLGTIEPYGDGALRGIVRVASCEPNETWAASTVLALAVQLQSLRSHLAERDAVVEAAREATRITLARLDEKEGS